MALPPTFGHVPEQPIVNVLSIQPGGGKWLDATAAGIRVGAVRLLGWDIHTIVAPPEYAGSDFYLIRLGHEVAMEYRSVRPAWIEVGFEFSIAGSDSGVTVVDALPRTVLEPVPPTSFVLNRSLMLVPGASDADCQVHLPQLWPAVDLFGLSSPEVRWRYTETKKRPLSLGALLGWVVLGVPAGTAEVTVDVQGAFEIAAASGRPSTGGDPVRFSLSLTPDGVVTPDFGSAETTLAPAPRVFISYAQENQEHADLVRDFSKFLCDSGIDARLDVYFDFTRIDWDEWATRELHRADYIAVVASPRMLIVGNGEALPGENHGLRSEFGKIRNLIQRRPEVWDPKVLPVVLPGRSVDEIPLGLSPSTKTHYKIADLTVAGAEDFLRVVTGQFRKIRPVIAPEIVSLPD